MEMFYLCFYTFLVVLIKSLCAANHYRGWSYINVHCRNNDNAPLQWWYIYKPPSEQIPFLDRGINFSYISPEVPGRWQASNRYLTDGSMLQHTLSPIFRSTYVDYVAVVAYEDKKSDATIPGSGLRGVFLADEIGGVWMTYTIPDFPDFTGSRPTFPESETQTGHTITCISLDLLTLNEVLMTLRNADPNFTFVHVPSRVQAVLPDWVNILNTKALRTPKRDAIDTTSLEFVQDNIRAMLITRKPGQTHCLYRKFAKAKSVILDVYNPSRIHSVRHICKKDYGIRRIDRISLKIQDAKVHYIDNTKDKSKFAVSTFAHWQRTGSGPDQQWTCTSNLHLDDDTRRGGHLFCVELYDLWIGFDNLKIKEPECNGGSRKSHFG